MDGSREKWPAGSAGAGARCVCWMNPWCWACEARLRSEANHDQTRREIPAAPARRGRVPRQPVSLIPSFLPSRSLSPPREQGADLRYLMRG